MFESANKKQVGSGRQYGEGVRKDLAAKLASESGLKGWRERASGPLGRSTPGHRTEATEAVGHQACPPGAFEQYPREREGFTQQQAEALRTRALHRLSLSPRVAGGVTPLTGSSRVHQAAAESRQ